MSVAQIELIADVLPELKTMIGAHYKELSLHRDRGFPLAPQFNVYLDRERMGMMVCATLRAGADLIGYKIGFVSHGLHYQTCLTALPDLFWINPEYRGGSGALRLFRCYERELRRRGVDVWFDSHKIDKGVPNTGRLFLALGFDAVETHYAKWMT